MQYTTLSLRQLPSKDFKDADDTQELLQKDRPNISNWSHTHIQLILLFCPKLSSSNVKTKNKQKSPKLGIFFWEWTSVLSYHGSLILIDKTSDLITMYDLGVIT